MTRHPEWVMDPKEYPIWQAPDSSRRVNLLVNKENCGAEWISAGLFWLAPGQKTVSDTHPESAEIYYVIHGQGKLLLEGEEYRVEKGMVVYLPPGVSHQSFNTGKEDLCYFYAFSPPPAGPPKQEKENWPRVQ